MQSDQSYLAPFCMPLNIFFNRQNISVESSHISHRSFYALSEFGNTECTCLQMLLIQGDWWVVLQADWSVS